MNRLLKTEMGGEALVGGGQYMSRAWRQKGGAVSKHQ